jgi:hypothetical protein
MAWNELNTAIRCSLREVGDAEIIASKTVGDGVAALYGKPQGPRPESEIVSYVFDKGKGWTLGRAREWFLTVGLLNRVAVTRVQRA